MDNSILIGKYIYKFLTEDDNINKITKGNIFPLVANENTNYPFIVFSRTSIVPVYDKDGAYQDNVEAQIICVSDDYSKGVDLANSVRNLLEFKHFEDTSIHISKIIVSNVSESYVEDAYLQIISLTIETV